ncbi:MAG: cupin domain-containing protein [Chloroflexi bacterium]|nr:cupin domain-containing protein [Chloroflexota bacterium]
MPYVPETEARNASRVQVEFDPSVADASFVRHKLLASASLRIVQLGFEPGFPTIPHYHPGAGEFFHILWGSGRFVIGEDDLTAVPGDLLYAPPGVIHQIIAGDGGLRFLAGVSPNEDRADEEIQVPDASVDGR